MKSQKSCFIFSSIMFAAGLLFISGCWKSQQEKTDSLALDSDQVLMTVNGKPVLTVQEYEEQLDMARKANAQIDMVLQMMPNAEREFIFRGIATGKIMKSWAEKNGIDQTDKFKQERKQLHDAMDLQLFMKYFDDMHPITVSDSDLAKFYEEKKDTIPALTLNQGGVNTTFVRFEQKDKAEKFFDKVKDAKKLTEFKAAAGDLKLKTSESIINEKSSFSEQIKKSILGLKKFPSVQFVKVDDKSFWVLFALNKTETKYRELSDPEVYQGLKKMMIDEQKEKQLMALIEQLKTELNVVENMKYFDNKENNKKSQGAGSNDLSEAMINQLQQVQNQEDDK